MLSHSYISGERLWQREFRGLFYILKWRCQEARGNAQNFKKSESSAC